MEINLQTIDAETISITIATEQTHFCRYFSFAVFLFVITPNRKLNETSLRTVTTTITIPSTTPETSSTAENLQNQHQI